MARKKLTSKRKRVTLKKVLDIAYLKAVRATLQEWSSQNDEEDYRDLKKR